MMDSYITTLPTDMYSTRAIDEYNSAEKKKICITRKERVTRTDAGLIDSSYTISVPMSQRVLFAAKESTQLLRNSSVKNQAIRLIAYIQFYLDSIELNNAITNRLPAISLLEREDTSVIVEWNFQSFRIGFILEANSDESSYYIVSEDRTLHQFTAETYPLGSNYEIIISSLIQYAIRNS